MKTTLITIKETKVHITSVCREHIIETPKVIHNVCFLKLTKSYKPQGMTPQELYEVTRKAWKISDKRTTQIEYIFATHNNIVLEVYKPIEWYAHIKSGRLMFEGILAPIIIRQEYIGMHISHLSGIRNPVVYNFK